MLILEGVISAAAAIINIKLAAAAIRLQIRKALISKQIDAPVAITSKAATVTPFSRTTDAILTVVDLPAVVVKVQAAIIEK